jgi:uncharacterized protein (DUF952 family)
MAQQRLFHLALPMPFSLAIKSGASVWTPAGFEREGFVHLSFAGQLRGTLNAHFASANEVYLLELDGSALAADLRLEPSRGAALFPHYYAPLPLTSILRHWLLHRRKAGFEVPYLAASAAEDIPPGEPAGPVA